MRPEKKFALECLQKAQNDLLSAKAVLYSPYGITDVPCFHAQQCVEKAFKGWLTWRNMIGRCKNTWTGEFSSRGGARFH